MDQAPSTELKLYATWPPVVLRVEDLGFFKDAHGRHFPRDIGRSSAFKSTGTVLIVFGDTFCHDYIGRYEATTSSTASILIDTDIPTISVYRSYENRIVSSFIPLNQDEIRLAAGPTCSRATLWCLGGIIETTPVHNDNNNGIIETTPVHNDNNNGIIETTPVHNDNENGVVETTPLDNGNSNGNDIAEGCVFYQKGLSLGPFSISNNQYTGLAKVRYDMQTGVLNVDRIEKTDVPFFKRDEPQFGTFNTLRVGNTAYLYGHVGPTDLRLMLAKVELVNGDELYNRDNYRYWNGRRYQRNIKRARPIMNGMKHGAIFRSSLFKPGTGGDYVFIGNRHLDNKVYMGISGNPEGPFLMTELMRTYFRVREVYSENTYCVYPHQWAFDESLGELMITWSEGGINGQIVAAKVKFEQRYQ